MSEPLPLDDVAEVVLPDGAAILVHDGKRRRALMRENGIDPRAVQQRINRERARATICCNLSAPCPRHADLAKRIGA